MSILTIMKTKNKGLIYFDPINISEQAKTFKNEEWLDFLSNFGGIISQNKKSYILGLNMPIEYYAELEYILYDIENLTKYEEELSESSFICHYIRNYQVIGYTHNNDILFYNLYNNNELVLWNMYDNRINAFSNLYDALLFIL